MNGQREPNDLESVRRVVVTQVVIRRGIGTTDDPVRMVMMMFSDDGHCLAEHDPCYPTPWYAPAETCRERKA